ncbi:Rha family transcriptional regulator [Lactobacillus crispatus]|uniref:Rha family transcriptional regulator n=1 Tax=Lactobacillus crispatus TaxID=47770 RepID=UPI0022E71792|nr:Rha family transcriptional regulator [Lactobacillus crispatus]
MNNLVIMKSKQALTTSLKVAETFEKKHQHVLRDIDSLKKDVSNFGHMFEETSIKDSYGREQRAYFMNRDGFTLLAMGYTGKKALQFKLKYIEAFNKMEKTIREQELPQTPEEKLQLTMEAAHHLDQRVSRIEDDLKDIKENAEVDESQRYQLLQERKKRVIDACGGSESNYYREKKAKKVFSEFGRDFKKAFEIPRYDCLKAKLFDDAIDFTKKWYPSFVLQCEIQDVNAQTRLPID